MIARAWGSQGAGHSQAAALEIYMQGGLASQAPWAAATPAAAPATRCHLLPPLGPSVNCRLALSSGRSCAWSTASATME